MSYKNVLNWVAFSQVSKPLCMLLLLFKMIFSLLRLFFPFLNIYLSFKACSNIISVRKNLVSFL